MSVSQEVYPHSRIFVGNIKTIDIAGPHIQVLENSTGNVLYSTTKFAKADTESVVQSGPVRCIAVDKQFRYLLTAGEDKLLKVWEVEGLKLLSQRELPKKPTSVAFTADGQTLLVSDKFGDIFSYPFVYEPLTVKQEKDALSSHENPSGGKLILGHASPLNAFFLTHDEKYIITADRDEHIRVSRYPKGYIIERYCLGHLKFVSAIHILADDSSTLISGGGDPSLKIWDWMSGKVKHEPPVWEAVEPFIAIMASKKKRGDGDEDGDEPLEGTRKKGNGRKGKGKAKQEDATADLEQVATPAHDGDGEEPPKPEKVLVIRRIDSIRDNSGTYVIFSAVGCTALFAFPFRADVAAKDIRHFDLGRPALDFYVADGNFIYVTLDGHWISSAKSDDYPTERGPTVKILKISSGELSEDLETTKALVEALNSSALIPATFEDLRKLDLYNDLTSMPKHSSDPEPDLSPSEPAVEDSRSTSLIPIGAPELSSSTTAAKGSRAKVELSKKEIGRMKTKQAVLAKAQEMEAGGGRSKEMAQGEKDTDERDIKRAKSDSGDVGPEEDVNMEVV